MAPNAIRRGGWAALAALAAAWGCQLFSPNGVYFHCDPDNLCPGDLECVANYCVERDAGFVPADAGGPYDALADQGPWCVPDGGPCVEYPLSGGRDLTAIAGLSPDEVWVAGAGGFTALWDGRRWRRLDAPGAGASIVGIAGHPAGPREWALASSGGIFRLNADAGTWEGPVPGFSPPGGPLTAVAANALSFVAVGENSVCVASNDSRTLSAGRRGFWNPGWERFDGGATLPVPSFRSAWGLPDGGFWVAADDGLYEVDLQGSGVAKADAGWVELLAVTASAEGRSWASLGSGGVLRYDGTKWVQLSGNAGEPLVAAAAAGNEAWFAGKTAGTLFRHNGLSMSPVPTGADQEVFALWSPPDGAAWAVGQGGLILHWDGGTWGPDPQGSTRPLNAVFAGPPEQLWAAGESATVLARNGNRWEPVALPSSVAGTIRAIWVGPLEMWLGVDNQIFHVSGTAAELEAIDLPDAGNITALWGSGDRPTVAAGEAPGGLYEWKNAKWASMDAGTTMYAVAGANGTVYAVGAGGRVMQNAGGGGWADLPGAGAAPVVDLHGAWTPDGGELWVAGLNSYVGRYYTGSWAPEAPALGVDFKAIAGPSANELYLVADAGTIFRFSLPSNWTRLPTGTDTDLLAATYQADAGLFVVGRDGRILHYAPLP